MPVHSDELRGIFAAYVFGVAAGVPPAILPGGSPAAFADTSASRGRYSGRQDAVLYGSQDGCRYSRKRALNRYLAALAFQAVRGHSAETWIKLRLRTCAKAAAPAGSGNLKVELQQAETSARSWSSRFSVISKK